MHQVEHQVHQVDHVHQDIIGGSCASGGTSGASGGSCASSASEVHCDNIMHTVCINSVNCMILRAIFLSCISMPNLPCFSLYTYLSTSKRIRAITNPSSVQMAYCETGAQFRSRPFELKMKEESKRMMNNLHFYNFSRITVAVYFTYFESIIVYKSTRNACSWSQRLKTFAFRSSEPLLLLRLMDVSASSLYIGSPTL